MKSSRLAPAIEKTEEEKWEEYVDSFEEPRSKDVWATENLWRLVGNGKQSHNWCGEHVGFLGCLNEDEHAQPNLEGVKFDGALIRHKHKSCFSYNCPVCYLSWAVQGAHRIADQLEDLGPKFGVADHIVLSLPNEYDDDGQIIGHFYESDDPAFDKLCKKIVKALLKRHVKGGCYIFHGFRYNDEKEAAEKNQPFGWYWSPHFHILGFVPNKAEFYATINKEFINDHFLVNLKPKRETVFGTAWYQLNHASIMFKDENFKVARWFGDTVSKETKQLRENSKKIKELKKDSSTEAFLEIERLQRENKEIKQCQKLKQEGNLKKHEQKCPICGKKMVKLEYFGLRTDLKRSLQECRKGRIQGINYYKNSKVMFFDSVIDGKNQVLNWAEK